MRAHKMLLPTLAGIVASLLLAQVSFCENSTSVSEPGLSTKAPLELLRDPAVRWDLELLDDQVKAIDNLVGRIRREIFKRYREAKNLSPEDRVALYREIQDDIPRLYSTAENELEEVLLPHQRRRLKQINLQLRLRTVAEHTLMSDEIADMLNLTIKQEKRLIEKAAEIRAEMQTKIDQIRREGEQKLLAEVLTPAQQEKLKRLLGRPLKKRRQ